MLVKKTRNYEMGGIQGCTVLCLIVPPVGIGKVEVSVYVA